MQRSMVSSATPLTVGKVTREVHRGQRAGWLRAAVLGADDGSVSIASVAIGVIASGASTNIVFTAAVAALAAGAMSMAAGEYVSVSSQRDTERGRP
jgi:vacuolar iron transporter family protein